MATRRWTSLATAALLVAAAGCAELTGPDGGARRVLEGDFAFQVPRAEATALVLEGITGTVQVTGSAEGGTIVVRGTRRTRADSWAEARAALRELDVEILETGDALFVWTVQPHDTRDVGYEVDYEITVPEDLDVEVEHITGSVVIRSVTGRVDVRNVTGSLSLLDTKGPVTGRLVTGVVMGRMAVPRFEVVDLGVTTGTLDVVLPWATCARMRASVVTGTLTVTGFGLVDEDPRSNVVVGTLGDGAGSLRLTVVTGTLRIGSSPPAAPG